MAAAGPNWAISSNMLSENLSLSEVVQMLVSEVLCIVVVCILCVQLMKTGVHYVPDVKRWFRIGQSFFQPARNSSPQACTPLPQRREWGSTPPRCSMFPTSFPQDKLARRTVFFRELDRNMTEPDLLAFVFSKTGHLPQDCKLSKFPDTGRCRGFGLAQMQHEEAMHKAVKILDGCMCKGRLISALPSRHKITRHQEEWFDVS